ncbi:MAG: hypothetical protein GWP20_01760, partial [Thermotogales bacterium]|nr:hypothetical protein [Thermotogales bacterium]
STEGGQASKNTGTDKQKSPECAKFAKDPGADIGDVIHAGCKPTLAQMSALMDNPVGNVAMMWNQIDYYGLENPKNNKSDNKTNYMGIIQWPQALNSNWNLINRVIYNVTRSPIDQDKVDDFGSAQGTLTPPSNFGSGNNAPIDVFGGSTTGLGDTYYVALFSPKKPVKMGNANFVWGLGFDAGFPTATDDVLGTEKYSAGPSALGVYLGQKWKLGSLAQHYWSYAGKSDRSDVNMTNLQYFYYYAITPTLNIGAGPNIIANWEQNGSDRFTVPVGIGANTTVNFGSVPVRIGLEFYKSVVKPDNVPGTDYNVRFYMIPAVPSALFKWMQKPLLGD